MGHRRIHRLLTVVLCAFISVGAAQVAVPTPSHAASVVVPAINLPLHTTGTDSVIYDAANRPVRLIGFNWSGTEQGGRNDYAKVPDACGSVWRTPSDGINGVYFDNMYQVVRDWGYNVIRLPISWNNLEPVAPVWSASLNRYVHTFNAAYVNDLKSMVTRARQAGLGVILDMHQDFWSPALHKVTNWDGSAGYCEGVGMPRWLDPSIDAKVATIQSQDFLNGMNWFYRNVHDPASVLTKASPWGLFYSAWDWISYTFSSRSGYADYQAVVGADVLNEPYFSYVGANPPLGQTVLQAAGTRLQAFYNAIAPAMRNWNPNWLLFFEDSTGGFNTQNTAWRESPTMTSRPSVPGNWVYSVHIYNFAYGTFDDGIARHDDFGITVANADLAYSKSWRVPLYIGEFTNFTMGVDARQLTVDNMAQTRKFLSWAKTNNVSWTFWTYVSTYTPMTVIDPVSNQAIAAVKNALDTGR